MCAEHGEGWDDEGDVLSDIERLGKRYRRGRMHVEMKKGTLLG